MTMLPVSTVAILTLDGWIMEHTRHPHPHKHKNKNTTVMGKEESVLVLQTTLFFYLLSSLDVSHAFTTLSYRTRGLYNGKATSAWSLTSPPRPMKHHERSVSLQAATATCSDTTCLQDLKVGIVGAGPSGLVLALALVRRGATVKVYERRARPSIVSSSIVSSSTVSSSRAYALGLGRRGRSAIQRAGGDSLWESVKEVGFESARFKLHLGPLTLTLRKEGDFNSNHDPESNKPSLLLFQSDLCAALTNALYNDYGKEDNRLSLYFQSNITDIDLAKRTLTTASSEDDGSTTQTDSFDLIVGCDGVNSIVRSAIQQAWPQFETTKNDLPGVFKAVRLDQKPPRLDPHAVSLVIGKTGSAFIEPTVGDSCCILFAASSSDESNNSLLFSKNATLVAELLETNFPLLQGINVMNAAQQLVQNPVGSASSVQCNTYHYAERAVLVGDAAHATGGVSGQGVNSALVDSVVLADCLSRHSVQTATDDDKSFLQGALLEYSQLQVPQGHALYDLSFPTRPESFLERFLATARNLVDAIFGGRWGIGQLPLQTRLTTSLEPFSEIRQETYSESPFPDQASWNATLADLHSNAMNVQKEKQTAKV